MQIPKILSTQDSDPTSPDQGPQASRSQAALEQEKNRFRQLSHELQKLKNDAANININRKKLQEELTKEKGQNEELTRALLLTNDMFNTFCTSYYNNLEQARWALSEDQAYVPAFAGQLRVPVARSPSCSPVQEGSFDEDKENSQ